MFIQRNSYSEDLNDTAFRNPPKSPIRKGGLSKDAKRRPKTFALS